MPKLNDYLRHEIIEIILYLFIVIFGGFVLPLMGGFSLLGFESSFSAGTINIFDYLGTFVVYQPLLIIALFLIIFPIVSLLTIRRGEHPATQPNPKWYRIFSVSLIFNPQDGALWQLFKSQGQQDQSNAMKWSVNILRIIIISILLFGLIGIFSLFFPKLSVVGVPVPAQQLTIASDVIFGSTIPSLAENGTLLFIFFFLQGIVAYFTSKFIKDKKLALLVFFIVGFLLVAPILATIWMSYHFITYGSSEIALQATWIFGLVGTWITLIFGILIPFLAWHFFNNFFLKLLENISRSEDIAIISGIIWVVLFFIYISAEIFLYKRRKGKREELIV